MTRLIEFPVEPYIFLEALSREVGVMYYRIVGIYQGVKISKLKRDLADSGLERECLETVQSRLMERLGE